MLNSKQIINTQTFFSVASNEANPIFDGPFQKFTLDPNGKDKKGLEHICYGDSNGGGHMDLTEKNLESKRKALREAHSPRVISDYEKLKNNLEGNLKRRLKILDEKYKSEGGIESASHALEKEKIEAKCKLDVKEGQKKFHKRVEIAV